MDTERSMMYSFSSDCESKNFTGKCRALHLLSNFMQFPDSENNIKH